MRLILVLLYGPMALAQVAAVDRWNIPAPLNSCLRNKDDLELFKEINPFYLRGDFDGDGRSDYFVKVRSSKNSKTGYLLCLAARTQSHLIGAGVPVAMEDGFLVDDFGTHDFDVWGVLVDPRQRSELIYLKKSESGDGYFRWNGTKLVWSQGSI